METSNEPATDHDRPFRQDEIEALWAAFRMGEVVKCPFDAQNYALSVDGETKSYRFVCSHCGVASRWFVSTPTGIGFRALEPLGLPAHD